MSGVAAKPCPFCGASHAHAEGDELYYHCGDCGAYGPNGSNSDQGLLAWNSRVLDAGLLEASQRLLLVFVQQRMTTAERIICGVSDTGLKIEGLAAIEALQAAVAKATGLAVSA